MKRHGNINSNRTYNPQNAKPHIPLDVDEVDAVLERFIRQKYDQQIFSSGTVRPAARHDTGSTRSSEDQPPPLPPKPARRFGFGLRAVSSTLPSRVSQISPPESPNGLNGYDQPPPSLIRVNKQSRIFGASVGGTTGDNMESKLATLKDMGFPDEKRNANILKGLGGNLERAIESLVRLGEGSAPVPRSRTPVPAGNIAGSQPLNLSLTSSRTTPQPTAIQSTANLPASNLQGNCQGHANQNADYPNNQATQTFNSSNPFQSQSYNPFEPSMPQSATYPLDRVFEGMQVSQPLFPNATGGYPSQQQQTQDARLQQSMTPPAPQPQHHLIQSNPYVQQIQAPTGNYNPFFQNTQQVAVNSSVSYPSTGQQQQTAAPSYNPFLHSTSMAQSPNSEYPVQTPQTYSQEQQPQQQLQHFQTSQPSQQNLLQQPPLCYDGASQGQQLANPYVLQQQIANDLTQNSHQRFPVSTQPGPHPLRSQQTGRFDKSSILALYNYPQLVPPPLHAIPQEPTSSTSPPTGQLAGSPAFQQQRSVTMPTAVSSGSKNPFQSAASDTQAGVRTSAVNGVGISRHISQESVNIGGFQNGRHSPDAFASLSANIVR